MLIKIGRETPLLGSIAFGIIDRGTNLLQIRATSVCNINCTFCSVDGGPLSEKHKDFYEVGCDYLLEEIEKVVREKETDIEINIDSVGEPYCYPHLEKLVEGLRRIKQVKRITIQTNATYDKDIDVDLINVSLHAMDETLAKELANAKCYAVEKVKEFIEKNKKEGRDIRICPVWIPGVNDQEIPKIIQYAKEKNCSLGIQKYEVYKNSRKHKKVRAINWWRFYKQIKDWEKEFDIQLQVKAKDLGIKKAKRIPEVFRKGERVQVTVLHPGWFKDQMIAKARGRSITIKNCDKNPGDKMNVKIMETKNNIYLAE